MRLKDKVAVITGAGSGMGKAMAFMFAAEGANVVLADISGKQNDVAAEIGAAAVGVHADVSKSEDVQNMIATAEKKFGKLDVLVNNAGFGGPIKLLAEQDEDTWDNVHSVNIRGVFLGMKYGILSMLNSGGGSIINIASAMGISAWKGHGVYSAAKAGVIQMGKVAALDYADKNIRVNAICPGMTWTGLVVQSAGSDKPPEGAFNHPAPLIQRWGLASEIASAALYFASDESAYTTGSVLSVDGGLAICGFKG